MTRLGARPALLAGLLRRRILLSVAAGLLLGLVGGGGLGLLAGASELAGALPVSGPALVDGAAAVVCAVLLFLIAGAGAGLGSRGGLKRAERIG